MAVFMLNVCKFNSCGLTFKSLTHLIQHIEETHIDYDPHVVERTEQQQPACIPLSYVLRFLTDAARRENAKQQQQTAASGTTTTSSAAALPQVAVNRPVNHSYHHPHAATNTTSTASAANAVATMNQQQQHRSLKSLTPTTGSEDDEEEEEEDDEEDDEDDGMSSDDNSNDSWTTLEEFSQDFILKFGSRVSSQAGSNSDKPFACPVPGCKKRYKNVNGIKYHSKNGHKNDGKVRKAFKCPCGKSYKTQYGLKNHTVVRHNNGLSTSIQVKLPSQPKQQQQQRSSSTDYDDYRSSAHRHASYPKMSKLKLLSAIQDHGYMKQDRSAHSGDDSEMSEDYEYTNGLGVLTPAASPANSSAGGYATKSNQQSSYHHDKYSSSSQQQAL